MAEKPLPPHLANKSNTSTPPPVNGSSAPTDKESPSPAASRVNGSLNDKDKAKKKDKNNNKKDKSENSNTPATPEIPTVASAKESSLAPASVSNQDGKEQIADDIKSPIEQGSSGTRTPKSGKPPRNPWTIFMRMASHLQVTDAEIKDFFGEAKNGITRINQPFHYAGKSKLAYVEFGDEEAMKAGFEKHLEVRVSSFYI